MAAEQPQVDRRSRGGNTSPPAGRVAFILGGLCVLLLASDVFLSRYGPFEVEHVFGFYAGFGLLAAVVVLLVARLVGPLVMRREDYYGR